MISDQRPIILVSLTLNTNATGVGKWSHEIAGALAARGHRPILWFDEDLPTFAKHRRLKPLFAPVDLAFRLVRERRNFSAVIIHEPSGFWYGLLRRVWLSLPPMIAMSHGIETRVFREMEFATKLGLASVRRKSSLIARLLRFWQSDGTLRLADHIICLSSSDTHYAATRLGIPSQHITLMINGVGRPFGQPLSTSNNQTVIFVGGWLDEKGKRLLPEIWKRVRIRFPDAQLRLVGTGSGKDIVAQDFEPNLEHSLQVIPRVENQEQMAAQYHKGSIFLMPSLREGSPLSLLEAMASGLVVVASRVGGIPDIVTDGVNGLLFDYTDIEGAVNCLALALTETDTDRLRQAAINTAQTLTWESSARALETAIERVTLPD